MTKTAIPKIIHFIWVGGALKKDVHKAYLQNWVRNRGAYGIRLWYDSEHMIAYELGATIKRVYKDNPGERERQLVEASWGSSSMRLDMLGKLLHDSHGIKDNGIASARSKLNANRQSLNTECPDGVQLSDVRAIVDDMQNKSIYEMEMVNRGGNFGAASDVLRLELLNKFGGVYSDLDLEALKPFGTLKCDPRYALIGRWKTQMSNALLGSHPGSLLIQRMMTQIKHNYQQVKSSEGKTNLDTYWNDVRSSTINLTGPTVIRTTADAVVVEAMRDLEVAYQKKRTIGRKEPFKNPYGNDIGYQIWNFQNQEMLFPDGLVNFDTDEQKIHDWL